MKKAQVYSAIICLILLISTSKLDAQKATIIWEKENVEKESEGELIAMDNGEYIKISYEIKPAGGFRPMDIYTATVIKKLDSNFNTIKSNKIPFKEKTYFADEYFKFNNVLYRRPTSYIANATAQKINTNTLEADGEVIDLGTIETARRTGLLGFEMPINNFLESKDKSKFLVLSVSAYDKKKKTTYTMSVYENNMKRVWDKKIELPYLDNVSVYYDCFITNEGKVGIITKQYDTEIKREDISDDYKKLPTYKTKIFLYNATDANPKEILIDVENKFVHTVDVTTEDANGNITLFGLYKTIQNGFIEGYFLSSLNINNNTASSVKKEDIPKDILQAISADLGYNEPSTRKLVYRCTHNIAGNNHYIFEFYTKEFLTPGVGFKVSGTQYTYGDILDICFSKTSNKSTFIRIPKYQSAGDFISYSGFKSIAVNNKLYFFYNDNKKNIETDLTKAPENYYATRKPKLIVNPFKLAKEAKKANEGTSFMNQNGGEDGAFVMATVDESGTLKREVIIDEKQQGITPCVINSIRLNKNKISLYQYYKTIFGSLEVN